MVLIIIILHLFLTDAYEKRNESSGYILDLYDKVNLRGIGGYPSSIPKVPILVTTQLPNSFLVSPNDFIDIPIDEI
jgi:hypothetical protein